MRLLADIALYVWPVVVLLLFASLPPRKAVFTALMVGWLFLPVHGIDIPMLPDYTKMSATCFGVFAGVLLFDSRRISQFRLAWFDAIVVVYCLSPLASSLANGLGMYDGVANVAAHVIALGLPYLIGRLYLRSMADLHAFAIAVFWAGVVYVPFCLYEVRMSPHLHRTIYEFHPGTYTNHYRFGGWRPVVFMKDGLQLSLWMATATLIGIWLWWKQSIPRIMNLAPGFLVAMMVVTTLLTRSTGAILVWMMGLAALAVCVTSRTRLALVALLLIPPTYMAVRTAGEWGWQPAVEAARLISDDRAGSLRVRFENEDLLVAKALERPLFGWGGWGRNRVYDEFGNDISVTDGLWVIELGQRGVVGLVSYFAVLLLPMWLLLRRYPVRMLLSRELAPALALAVVVVLYAIDCLPNAMPNPVYLVAAGGVMSFATSRQPVRSTGSVPVTSQRQSVALPRQLAPATWEDSLQGYSTAKPGLGPPSNTQ